LCHQAQATSSCGKGVTLQSKGPPKEPKGVLPMEEVNDVQGKSKRTRPPRGERGDQIVRIRMPSRLRSGVKRYSYVWRKASPWSGWPAKWAWAAAPYPSGQGCTTSRAKPARDPGRDVTGATMRLRATRHAILRILSFPPRYPAQPPSEATPSAKSSVI
jgi:hypothetical protein